MKKISFLFAFIMFSIVWSFAQQANYVFYLNSVATWAKEKGCRVGVSTSVIMDHTTPASFYVHQSKRGVFL